MILPPHPPRIESLKALLSDRKKADSTGDKGSQDISLAQKQRPIFHHYYHFLSFTGHIAFELTSQTKDALLNCQKWNSLRLSAMLVTLLWG